MSGLALEDQILRPGTVGLGGAAGVGWGWGGEVVAGWGEGRIRLVRRKCLWSKLLSNLGFVLMLALSYGAIYPLPWASVSLLKTGILPFRVDGGTNEEVA